MMPAAQPESTMPQPFADHSHDYIAAGWRGVLWLRPETKWPPPTGYTGYRGGWPSPADVYTWSEDHPNANIALRLSEDTLGIDVDAYDDKPGATTLDELQHFLGPLPPTVLSTSRDDGTSGIRLYRVPPHASWPDRAGPGIELIHYGHRYAVVWPSTHPDGGTYRWIDQRTGEILDRPPRAEDLPELPDAWVEYLQADANEPAAKTDVDELRVRTWLDQLRQGNPCAKVAEASENGLRALDGGDGSRHDVMTRTSARLVGYGAWGHAGVSQALTDLYAAFIDKVTQPGPGQRTTDDAVAEWRRSVSGAVAMHHQQRPIPGTACSCPLPSFDPEVETDFWTARPQLAHLRQHARARRTSPWAVLAITLTRIVTSMQPRYVLPPIIGGHASLNLFVGIVARSGGGKGAAESAAEALVDVGDLHTVGVGSGEGILHQYVRRVPADKTTGEPARIDQHQDRVLFTASEVDTLANLHSRQGSTLLAELRKLYMGEQLSFAYVDPTKRLTVDKHTYRAGLIVGVQPERAGTLLDDADGGTPQRFLWMPGTDPDMPDIPPDLPGPLTWQRPVPLIQGPELTPLDVCKTATETIDREHVRRNRGDGDALDGHALLTRLKWAAALAILDSRLDVNDDDWQLAGTIQAVSDHTRRNMISELEKQHRQANLARGLAQADREELKELELAQRAAQRVRRHITAKLTVRPWKHSELRRSCASRDRGTFDVVVQQMVDERVVEATDSHPVIYRLSPSVA